MSRQQQAIEAPGAWLTKVASRICLDLLGSARARRERYVGEWRVAKIVGRTPAACRQLASSARRRIWVSQPPATPATQQGGIVRAFKRAWQAGTSTP